MPNGAYLLLRANKVSWSGLFLTDEEMFTPNIMLVSIEHGPVRK